MTDNAASDDRVPNEISFAATNLVKPDLTSTRRKSDTPPVKEGPASGGLRAERQAFPPTPPPENEFAPSKPMRSNTVAGGSSRSLSIRSGAPRTRSREEGRDDRDRVTEDSERYLPRRPTVRGPEPRRAQSTRTPAAAPATTAQRSRTVRERGHDRSDSQRRRPNEYSEEAGENPYSDEIYDSYAGAPLRSEPPRGELPRRGGGGGSIRRDPTRRGANRAGADRSVDDDEYASDAYEGSSFDDEDEFEMLDARSVRSGSSRRPPEVKKVYPDTRPRLA